MHGNTIHMFIAYFLNACLDHKAFAAARLLSITKGRNQIYPTFTASLWLWLTFLLKTFRVINSFCPVIITELYNYELVTHCVWRHISYISIKRSHHKLWWKKNYISKYDWWHLFNIKSHCDSVLFLVIVLLGCVKESCLALKLKLQPLSPTILFACMFVLKTSISLKGYSVCNLLIL